eukprot:EG_transcript_14040
MKLVFCATLLLVITTSTPFSDVNGSADLFARYDFQQFAARHPSNDTWSPVQIILNRAIFFARKKIKVGNPLYCYSTTKILHAFHLQDIVSVGHMHRTFTTFFSYLLAVPPQSKVVAVWGESINASRHASVVVKQLVYEPMLQMYQRFFNKHRGLQIQVIEFSNTTECLHVQELGNRQCILEKVPKLVVGTTGNCGNWFASAETVAAWRAMLASEAGLTFPLHNLVPVPERSPWVPWSVLVYDRPGGRRFQDPEGIRKTTLTYLRRHIPSTNFIVQRHIFLEPDFYAQCHLFNRYDLIILVHGAGASHMVCARPGAMVIEVGWWWYGSFFVLARQLGTGRAWPPPQWPASKIQQCQ